MAKNIEPNLKKIGAYLKLNKDVRFVIPEYQRAYSWGINNCDTLWQDVLDFTKDSNKDNIEDPYFFGTIIVNCQNNDKEYILIDGQQRTTTFLLLLKSLLIHINKAIAEETQDKESENVFSGLKNRRKEIISILYRIDIDFVSDEPNDEKDSELYKQHKIIIENKSINEQYKDDLQNILESINYEDIKKKATKIKYKQKDNQYTNFFKNFKFFYDKIESLDSPMLNTITKSIIGNCEVIEIKSWQVEQAITMFNSLNSDGLPLFDSDIISAKLYAKANETGENKKLKELWKELLDVTSDLEKDGIASINSIFTQYMYFVRAKNGEIRKESGAIEVTTPGLRKYFTEINKNIINNPIDTCEKLLNLAKVWQEAVKHTTLKVLLKFNENAKLFLGGYFVNKKYDDIKNELKDISETMLRLFAILEIVDKGYSSTEFKTFLFGIEVDIVEKMSINDIKKKFDDHISKYWSDIDDIKKQITDCDKNSLVYLNEYLFAKEKEKELDLNSRCDIEHIMPSSGKNLKEIRKDAEIEDEEEFKNNVNKIGNKILLESKINRALGNEWFRTKISYYKKYPIAEALKDKYKNDDNPKWTKKDINNATEKASDRIAKFIFSTTIP